MPFYFPLCGELGKKRSIASDVQQNLSRVHSRIGRRITPGCLPPSEIDSRTQVDHTWAPKVTDKILQPEVFKLSGLQLFLHGMSVS